MDEYKASIHQSLTRPQLFLGCDRELFLVLLMFTAFIIGPLGIFKGNYFAIPIGAGIWILGQMALIRMAQNDPFTRHIFVRSLSYGDYYPSAARVTEAEPDRARR